MALFYADDFRPRAQTYIQKVPKSLPEARLHREHKHLHQVLSVDILRPDALQYSEHCKSRLVVRKCGSYVLKHSFMHRIRWLHLYRSCSGPRALKGWPDCLDER